MDYPRISGCSVFTLGMNMDYLAELFEGDPLRIETLLVDHDPKRIHYFHRMFHRDTDQLAATNECLCMNVNLATRKSEPFPVVVMERLVAAQSASDRPERFGRTLTIRRR
jgi:acyl-CoA thioester hydrolase